MNEEIKNGKEGLELPEHFAGYDDDNRIVCFVIKVTKEGYKKLRHEGLMSKGEKPIAMGWFVNVDPGNKNKTKGPFKTMEESFEYCSNKLGVKSFRSPLKKLF